MSISVFYNNNFDHPIIFLRSKKSNDFDEIFFFLILIHSVVFFFFVIFLVSLDKFITLGLDLLQ